MMPEADLIWKYFKIVMKWLEKSAQLHAIVFWQLQRTNNGFDYLSFPLFDISNYFFFCPNSLV